MTMFQPAASTRSMSASFQPRSEPTDDPAEALSNLRMARLEGRLEVLPEKVRRYGDAAEDLQHGFGDVDLHEVADRFAEAFREFHETADAANKAGLVNGEAREVVDRVMGQVRQEFRDGLKSMRDATEGLRSQQQAKEFALSALEKLEKMRQFWERSVDTQRAGDRNG